MDPGITGQCWVLFHCQWNPLKKVGEHRDKKIVTSLCGCYFYLTIMEFQGTASWTGICTFIHHSPRNYDFRFLKTQFNYLKYSCDHKFLKNCGKCKSQWNMERIHKMQQPLTYSPQNLPLRPTIPINGLKQRI